MIKGILYVFLLFIFKCVCVILYCSIYLMFAKFFFLFFSVKVIQTGIQTVYT